MRKENLKDKILQYGLILFIILDFNTTYYNSSNFTSFNAINKSLICFMLICNILNKGINVEKTKKSLSHIFIYIIYIIGFAVINTFQSAYQIKEFIFSFIILEPLFIVLFYIKGEEYLKSLVEKFIKLIMLLCILSLFFYIFGSILKIINYTNYVNTTWGWREQIKNYWNIYFETQYIGVGENNFIVPRNSLFFCEPAMFSVLIALATMLNKVNNNNHKNYTVIFLITQLTTDSTTGIIITIVFYALEYIISNKRKNIKVILIPSIMMIVLICLLSIIQNKLETSSGSTRVDDIRACIFAWKDSPIVGNGFLNNKNIENYLSSFRSGNKGLSSSFFIVLAHGGIYLISVYIYSFVKLFIYFIKKKDIRRFMIVIMYIIIFLTTIFEYTALSMLILSLGIIINSFYKEGIEGKNDKKQKKMESFYFNNDIANNSFLLF